MRKKLYAVALVTACVVTGCNNVPDLSHVDNNLAAQYVADALLKNDKHYDESLDYDHSMLIPTATPVPTISPTPEDISTETPNESGTTGSADGNTGMTSVSLSEVYGIQGIEVKPVSYEIKSTYGAGSYAVITARKGMKLVVVHFKVSNTANHVQKVDLAAKNVSANLLVNGENAGSPLLSIADGDLQTFRTKMSKGQKKQGVLLFEVSKSTKISSVEVQFENGNSQASVSVR